MGERIDYAVKWYLRIVIGSYLLMFIPMTIVLLDETPEYLLLHLKDWYLVMPFFSGGFVFDKSYLFFIHYFNSSPIPYIFWSFWIITFLRWITTGKHFWQ